MTDEELLESISYLIEENLDEYVNRELAESISYLIDEDLDEYVKRAPVHNGKKVLSERAWEALWDKYFHEYERKEIMSVQESREYEEETRKFGDMYECCI